MSALVVSQPDVPFFARASNTIRAIALGALVAMAIGLAALLGSSHDSRTNVNPASRRTLKFLMHRHCCRPSLRRPYRLPLPIFRTIALAP